MSDDRVCDGCEARAVESRDLELRRAPISAETRAALQPAPYVPREEP